MTTHLPDQVFIVGMNGSGTTMLLDHLSNHSLLFGYPGETKCLPYFITHQSKYGDLADDQNFLQLWHDLTWSISGRTAPGPDRIPVPDNWRELQRTAASIFNHVMFLFAKAKGKQIWCEKTPMHVHHLSLLAEAFPNAKFIHVIRDGRDCAASFHRRWKFNPLRTIYRWKIAVRAGRAQGQVLGSRYHEVHYEDVTKEPEKSLRSICNFLGIPFEESMLTAARSRPEVTGSTAKLIAPNERRATSYFRSAQLQRIDLISGKCLAEFGYLSSHPDGDRDPAPWMLRFWEIGDDVRQFARVTLAQGRLFKPKQWLFLARRLSGALKQKASLPDR